MRLIAPTSLLVASCCLLSAQTTLLIGPNNPGSTVAISSVSYDDNGTPVTQTSTQTGSPIQTRNTELNLTGIVLDDPANTNLDIFNFSGAEISLGNFANEQPAGIGVLNSDGTQVALSSGTAAFTTAAEDMLQSPDLNSYLYYDGISNDPAAGTADFTINFRFSFEPTDYILVQERFGNTFFELTALDINGNPISTANVLKFGENGGSAYSVYDWNSGFANASYQSGQSYAFSVTQASQFFSNEEDAVPIYGFQVDNDGEADVKFFGASDDTFLDNPFNPAIAGAAPIPEPSSLLLVASSALLLGVHRRR